MEHCESYFTILPIELPCNPAVPLLGIYLKDVKSVCRRDVNIPMHMAAIFTIARLGNSLSVDHDHG
jgi:hypothetical protein